MDWMLLQNSNLFFKIAPDELRPMLKCLGAAERTFLKGTAIYRPGDSITSLAFLLEGCVHILREDYWGNQNLLTEIEPGELFGETFACLPGTLSNVEAVASMDSKILFIDMSKVLSSCSNACPYHACLVQNLSAVLARKNLMLNRKLEYLAQRTTREKLLSYLSAQSQQAGSPSFEISFNRQQLADYLSIDRSAMSKELCRMRDEGLLRFQKNRFELL